MLHLELEVLALGESVSDWCMQAGLGRCRTMLETLYTLPTSPALLPSDRVRKKKHRSCQNWPLNRDVGWIHWKYQEETSWIRSRSPRQ